VFAACGIMHRRSCLLVTLSAAGIIVRVIKRENNVIGGTCSTYAGEVRRIQGFGGET